MMLMRWPHTLAIPDQNAVVAAEVMVIPRSWLHPSSPWLQRRRTSPILWFTPVVTEYVRGSSGFTGVDVRTDTDVTVACVGAVRAICFLVYLLGVQFLAQWAA